MSNSPLNSQYFSNITKQINSASSVASLQQIVEPIASAILAQQGSINTQLAATAPIGPLLEPPTTLPQVVTWAGSFIDSVVTPQYQPYLKYISQLVQLASVASEFTQAANNKASALGGSISLPALSGLPSNPTVGQQWYDVANSQSVTFDGENWNPTPNISALPYTSDLGLLQVVWDEANTCLAWIDSFNAVDYAGIANAATSNAVNSAVDGFNLQASVYLATFQDIQNGVQAVFDQSNAIIEVANDNYAAASAEVNGVYTLTVQAQNAANAALSQAISNAANSKIFANSASSSASAANGSAVQAGLYSAAAATYSQLTANSAALSGQYANAAATSSTVAGTFANTSTQQAYAAQQASLTANTASASALAYSNSSATAAQSANSSAAAASASAGLSANSASLGSGYSSSAQQYSNTAVAASQNANSASASALEYSLLSASASNTANGAANGAVLANTNAQVAKNSAITANTTAWSAASVASTEATLASQSAIAAGSSASAANISAGYAASNATLTQSYATAANTSQLNAAANAVQSATSASASQASAAQSSAYASASQQNATVSQGWAGTASTQAGLAQGYSQTALTASQTATSASQTATTQSGLAVSSATNAQTASNNANTAQNNANYYQGLAYQYQGLAYTYQGQAATANTNSWGAATSASLSEGTAASAATSAQLASDNANTAQNNANYYQGLAYNYQGEANTYQGQASTANTNAWGAASAASLSSGTAASAKNTAQAAATNAQNASNNANTAQNNANYYQGLSNTYQEQASSANTSAWGAATSASLSSGTAASSASAAQGASNSANTAAASAQSYSSSAHTYSNQASSSNTSAQGAASAAAASAGIASQAANNANTASASASFSSSQAASSALTAQGAATASVTAQTTLTARVSGTTTGNLVPNPAFLQGATDWTITGGGGVSGPYGAYNQCAYWYPSSYPDFGFTQRNLVFSNQFPVTEYLVYSTQFVIYAGGLNPTPNNTCLRIVCYFYDNYGNTLQGNVLWQTVTQVAGLQKYQNDSTQGFGTVTAPANAFYAVIGMDVASSTGADCYGNPNGDGFLLTQVQFEQSEYCTTFTDNQLGTTVGSTVAGLNTTNNNLTTTNNNLNTTNNNLDTTNNTLNTTVATVSEQASAIATLNGYTDAHLVYSATSGGGTALFSIDSNTYGTGIGIVANQIHFGDAIVADETSQTIQFTENGYMKVTGCGFGSSNQFIEWFGPQMALSAMSEGNAIYYLKTNGSAYFGGALTTGPYHNSSTGSAIAPSTSNQVTVGPFGTDGNPITIAYSYSYFFQEIVSGNHTPSGSESCVVTITESIGGGAYNTIGTLNLTGTVTRSYDAEFAQTTIQVSMSGSGTYTDSAGGTATRTVVMAVSRTDGVTISGTLVSSSISQDGTIVTSEN